MVGAKAVRFDKHFGFLEPQEKLICRAEEFNVAEGASTEYMASDAYVLCLLSFSLGSRNSEELLECFFTSRK